MSAKSKAPVTQRNVALQIFLLTDVTKHQTKSRKARSFLIDWELIDRIIEPRKQ